MNRGWRILITDGLAPEGIALLRAEAETVEENGLEALASFDAVIVRSRTHLPASGIERARPRLRALGRAGGGRGRRREGGGGEARAGGGGGGAAGPGRGGGGGGGPPPPLIPAEAIREGG